MSGKEWQKLLQRLPDLAAKHSRQRFWQLLRLWSLRAAISALLVSAAVLVTKTLINARTEVAVSPSPDTTDSSALETQASFGATPYESPNPEIRQEFRIKRNAALQTPPLKPN